MKSKTFSKKIQSSHAVLILKNAKSSLKFDYLSDPNLLSSLMQNLENYFLSSSNGP